jgi:hydroxyethylthiazole kinase
MQKLQAIADLLTEVKTKKPLVHHLTNYVTVNDCANIVLALGGSPVMADDAAEVEEMVAIASALVLNIGTLNGRTIDSMFLAGKRANRLGIPVVLDPVGAGATTLRTATALRLVQEIELAVVRGNIAEITALAGGSAQTRGVDAAGPCADAPGIAAALAQKLGCVVAVTGAQDVVADGSRIGLIDNGHPILARVTGTGCMATSLVGCYAGVTRDYFRAAAAGIITMGLAGERALAALAPDDGIGSFRVKLLDQIDRLTPEEFIQGGKYHEA